MERRASPPVQAEDSGFRPSGPPATNKSQSAKAFGVDTPIAGVATTHAIADKSGKGKTSSPRPTPNTVPPTKNKGKSDPTSAAIPNRSGPDNPFFSARSSAKSVATAFPEAPPSPPCTGNRFSISTTTRPRALSATIARSTIRQQVFDSSFG